MICGALSAVLYTITNICLRQLGEVDAVWVSTVKAVPTLLVVFPMVMLQIRSKTKAARASDSTSHDTCNASRAGHWGFISWSEILLLVLTSLGTQIFGNVAFQWALSVLGLTISVPIVLATMLIGGALAGYLILSEPVSIRKVLSVCVLIIATIVLSLGAATGAGGTTEDAYSPLTIGLALAANIASGIAYAMQGTMMRRGMRKGMSVAATLCLISGSGVVFLVCWSLAKVGAEGIMATSSGDLALMICAGAFNALAFFAMAKSLQLVSVLYVQILNASQAAISAAAGWLIFSEAINTPIGIGLLLTAAGLMIAGLRDQPPTRASA
jgi:drug/metabolite transporter, DME family